MIRVRSLYDDVGFPNPDVGMIKYSEVERVEAYIKDLERRLKIAENKFLEIKNDNIGSQYHTDIAEDALNLIRGEWNGEPVIRAETLTADHINDAADITKRGE